MTHYNIALFLHILGTIGLFAGAGIILVAMTRMRRAQTVAQIRELASLSSGADKLMPAASLLILIPGIYMAVDGEWFGSGWVDFGTLGLIVMMALGPLVNARRLSAVHRSAEAAPDGPVPADLRAKVLDPVLWTSLHTMTVAGVGIVYLMAVKPGMVGSLVVMVIALLLGLGASMPAWRRASQLTAEEA